MDSAMYMYRYLFIYLSLCMCTCIYFDTNVQFFFVCLQTAGGNFLPVVQCGVHESMGYLENHACGAWGSLICVPTKFPNLTPKEDIQKVCFEPIGFKKKSQYEHCIMHVVLGRMFFARQFCVTFLG